MGDTDEERVFCRDFLSSTPLCCHSPMVLTDMSVVDKKDFAFSSVLMAHPVLASGNNWHSNWKRLSLIKQWLMVNQNSNGTDTSGRMRGRTPDYWFLNKLFVLLFDFVLSYVSGSAWISVYLLGLPHHLGWQTITKCLQRKSAEMQEMSRLLVFSSCNLSAMLLSALWWDPRSPSSELNISICFPSYPTS